LINNIVVIAIAAAFYKPAFEEIYGMKAGSGKVSIETDGTINVAGLKVGSRFENDLNYLLGHFTISLFFLPCSLFFLEHCSSNQTFCGRCKFVLG
jgi:hypothetical protein